MPSSTRAAAKACLDVLRRTDPREVEKHLDGLTDIVADDDLADELHQRVDVPFKIGVDTEAGGRKFLLCEHNRDGDSHRSPWTNAYHPPLDDGLRPSERLRAVELQANEALDVYRELYYGKASSVGSVYLWDQEGTGASTDGGSDPSTMGFAGCFLLKNEAGEGNDWNSTHVVNVVPMQKGVCRYELTSTLLLAVAPDELPSTALSGSLVRRNVREGKVGEDGDHVVTIGGFLEDVESEMRSAMDGLYIQKARSVVQMVRKERPGARTEGQEHTRVLNEAVLAMAVSRRGNAGDA
ncbi:hypothetical protein ACHAXT_009715 [Thalassiosira profunda]